MLGCARYMGLPNLQISIGHVGIVQGLMEQAKLDAHQQNELVDILKRKALPEYQAWLASQAQLSDKLSAAFSSLPLFCGEAQGVITQAKPLLRGITAAIDLALGDLETLANYLINTQQLNSHLDLSDLRGFQYHTGVIFACYSVESTPVLLAKGGRYDEVCAAFGEAHPATGFSLDLRNLLDHLPDCSAPLTCVYAPISQDPALYAKVTALRSEGTQVVRCYQGNSLPQGASKLVEQNGCWIVQTN